MPAQAALPTEAAPPIHAARRIVSDPAESCGPLHCVHPITIAALHRVHPNTNGTPRREFRHLSNRLSARRTMK